MRILLADDQPEVRSAMRLLLEQDPHFAVVGEVSGSDGLVAQAKETSSDVVLLDWELPGMRPSELLKSLHSACPSVKVVGTSGRPEARRAALATGVDAFVSKGDPPEQLLLTLRAIGGNGQNGDGKG